MQKLLISGHRGTRVHAIENTRAAFAFCMENGFDYIEFDVKKTRDRRLVVFHDERIEPLLDGTGPVESFTLEELRGFHYADGQGIQTLEEFFDQVGAPEGAQKDAQVKKSIKPMLEIKSRGCSDLVIDLVHRYGYGPQDILIQSFDRGDITACHELDPSLTYGLCIGGLGKFSVCRRFLAALFLRLRVGNAPVTWLNLDGPFIYDEFIDAARRRGLRIILGAKNPENYLDKLDRWGVEVINADDGVALRVALDAFGKRHPAC